MSDLDIHSPKGKVSLADEAIAASIFEKRYPGLYYINTDKDGTATVDGLIISKQRQLLATVETKCRYDMDLRKFRTQYKSEWLVTKEKIDDAQVVAYGLNTKLVGFLYIVPSITLLTKDLWIPDRGWVCPMYNKITPTQATINGGLATRDNYFIDMTGAEETEFEF